MAKPRAQKLKVFRTPAGFYDAYVAAPSQKAALEAWGTDSNLFASGAAEQVTDPKLMEAALERPGEVIKVVRGSEAEHLAALGGSWTARAKAGRSPSKAGMTKVRGPKPSRREVEAAEKALTDLETRQRAELREIAREEEELRRRHRSTERRHEAERDEASASRDRAAREYGRALRAWEKGRQ